MAELTVEYLAIVEEAKAFCKDVESFKRLVQVDSSIKLHKNHLTFADGFACNCHIIKGEVPERGQQYFHLKFAKDVPFDPSDELIESFLTALGLMRGIILKAGGEMVSPPEN